MLRTAAYLIASCRRTRQPQPARAVHAGPRREGGRVGRVWTGQSKQVLGALTEQTVTAQFPSWLTSARQIGAASGKITDGGAGAGRVGCGRAGAMTVIEVAIGPGGAPRVFRVEVVASPAGEASLTVELDADALLARRGLLQQAVLASAVPTRHVLPETERPVRDVGQVLFAGLLGTGEVAGRYRAAAAVAAERGEGLRVVLRIDSPVLAGLPWEAMYDGAAGV